MRELSRIAVGLTFLVWSAGGSSGHPVIRSIDPPGATATQVTGINNGGEVVGFFETGSGDSEGFVREPDGTIKTFAIKHVMNTLPLGVNDKSQIVGGADGSCFVRKPGGKTVVCNPAGVSVAEGIGINSNQTVAGLDFTNSGDHGFVWDSSNGATEFDAPGAIVTEPVSINKAGLVAGHWSDANGNTHGFIRDGGGTLTSFDVTGGSDTEPAWINASRVVVGRFFGSDSLVHSFVRGAGGAISVFDPPKSAASAAVGINKAGVITGRWVDQGEGNNHAYIKRTDGTFKTFDYPLAISTSPVAINDAGAVAGNYFDGVQQHGFVRTP